MVTGATSGIGEACALRFAKEGYDVIITGRRDHLLQALAERIEALGVRAKTLCFDVRDQQQVFDVCGSLEADWAEIDVLINNAGLALGLDPLQGGDLDDWNTMIDTNIKGLLYVSRALVPGMVERNRGEIINIGSVAGLRQRQRLLRHEGGGEDDHRRTAHRHGPHAHPRDQYQAGTGGDPL